jgi:hypothetical protein
MQLQVNHEGEQYMIGMPVPDKSGIFFQYVVDACLLDWVPGCEGKNIVSFESPEQAERAVRDLRSKKLLGQDDDIQIYKVNVTRLDKTD